MIAAFLIGFLICTIICIIYYRKTFRRKRDPLGIRLLICLFGAAVLETEAAFWLRT